MLPEALGVYFWAGLDVPNALVPGLRLFQQSGFVSTTRIRLTPAVRPLSATDRAEYRFDSEWEAQVPVGAPFLPAAVKSTQYQRAFNLPGLRTIVLSKHMILHLLVNPESLLARREREACPKRVSRHDRRAI